MCRYSAPPGHVRSKAPERPKLGPLVPVIDAILEADKTAPPKQRHTAKRIFERLRIEHGYAGGYTVVKDYVRIARTRSREAFVPLAHPPGHAQVDFGECIGVIGGVRMKLRVFCFDRRRIEFLDFMNEIAAAYPDTAIHVVLDNLNTHKPKNDRWLKRHPNVHFHFTPTRASWLNQVEIWFSILQGNSLKDASFTSVKQLREHTDAFIEAYNENAKAFAWTKSHQKRLKARFADQ